MVKNEAVEVLRPDFSDLPQHELGMLFSFFEIKPVTVPSGVELNFSGEMTGKPCLPRHHPKSKYMLVDECR